MAETAAHLVDRVLPEVPIRQWVLTLPYLLRYRCAWNARLTSAVLRAFLRSVFADQRRRARTLYGVRRGHCGSVTLIQRFGSALNLTPHFHSLVLDGVYLGPSHDVGDFVALPPPETDDVARVLAGTARRILRLLERDGIDGQGDPVAGDDPLMAMLGSASIRSRIATGPEAGEPWRRLGDRVEPVDEDEEGVEPRAAIPPRCIRQGGMSLHADVAVPAPGELRERARSCLSSSESDIGSTGAGAGADAGNGRGEARVDDASDDSRAERSESRAHRIAWADLLKRIFEVDALRCPSCGGRMRLIAAITDPSVARRILESLALPPRAPPLTPANEIDREPIVDRCAFERTPAEADGDPGFDFDQSAFEDPVLSDEP